VDARVLDAGRGEKKFHAASRSPLGKLLLLAWIIP
jgi:hypothetical protein